MINAADILKSRILIVDDLAANVALLEQMLRKAGYDSITSTQNPLEVCELHRQHRYDLILLDLEMPVMDGFQVMAKLKEIETSDYLPVLVITATPDHRLHALQAGARDFVSKPFLLAEILIRAHNLLEVRLLQREAQRLCDRFITEQKHAERLLLNVLPPSVAQSLKAHADFATDSLPKTVADSFPEVTVLFADIVGFTQFSKGLDPAVLVGVLNDIFTSFDQIADRCGLGKIKTIGDSYMAAAGLFVPVADHAERAAHMALDMLAVMNDFNQQGLHPLKVRIGLNTGAIVAGIIGQRKFHYDLWGGVVNTASRMESTGLPGRIQITDTTRRQLGKTFECEERGVVEITGEGKMRTWFLTRRSD